MMCAQIEKVLTSAYHEAVQMKPLKKQKHQPENQIIQECHPITGFAINAPNMLIVTMAFASVEMVGLEMALNASTIVRMIRFGKMIAV